MPMLLASPFRQLGPVRYDWSITGRVEGLLIPRDNLRSLRLNRPHIRWFRAMEAGEREWVMQQVLQVTRQDGYSAERTRMLLRAAREDALFQIVTADNARFVVSCPRPVIADPLHSLRDAA